MVLKLVFHTLIIQLVFVFEIYGQFTHSIDVVEKITLTVTDKENLFTGYDYVMLPSEDSTFKCFQMKSFVLPNDQSESFELFYTLDSIYKYNPGDFVQELILGSYNEIIFKYGYGLNEVIKFFGNRLMYQVSFMNSKDTILVREIPNNSVKNLLENIYESEFNDSIESFLKYVCNDINGRLQNEQTIKDRFLKSYSKKQQLNCLDVLKDSANIKEIFSLLMEPSFEIGQGINNLTVTFFFKDGIKLGIETIGNNEFMLPILIDNQYESFNPKLSRLLADILPVSKINLKEKLSGNFFSDKLIEHTIILRCPVN